MMRTRFMEGLDELKDKLLRMGGLAERSVGQAIAAYREHDRKCCEDVFLTENAINVAEREIDELALDLLAMQQPMASDLRFILAVFKINGDLERVGDQAVNSPNACSTRWTLPPPSCRRTSRVWGKRRRA